MKTSKRDVPVAWVIAVAALILVTGCTTQGATNSAAAAPAAAMPAAAAPAAMPATAAPATKPVAATLTGAEQVPPAPTSAAGKSTIRVGPDKMVTGTVEVTGMAATAAHIHEAAKGMNGPVIVPFVKISDNSFAPAPGAQMTDAQYASYLAGNTYINVHSATYPGGEIRVQLAPAK